MKRTSHDVFARAPGAALRPLVLLFALAMAGLPAQATIRYAVSVAQPEAHRFHVTMTIPAVKGEVIVQLPAWNALYQIRDFAHHVIQVHAADDSPGTLPVAKLDKQTWRITGDGAITLRYDVFWDEAGPFSSQLNASHAFLNLATVLFYVPDRRNEDVRLVFDDLAENWRVAVALQQGEKAAGASAGAYIAPNYDALVDAPVEIGAFEELRLEGSNPPVRIVLHGDGPADPATREKLAETVRRIVAYGTQLMGGAPYDEYLFVYHIGVAAAGAAGGMEHANSTAIFTDSVAHLANVTAHEFFHLWNVKRIRPQSLEPVDYTREQWTRALWFAEGVTSTYGAYTLVRTGLWTRRQFYDDLAFQITEVESRPAHHWKSVEEASLDAWLEKYGAYRGPGFSISYYNKGQILGVLLDILIRDATDNRAGLDDVLRELNEKFARRGRFYRDTADIRAVAELVAGRSFEEFFSRYVAGTDELPCAELLARAGLHLKGQGRARAELGFWPGRGPNGSSVATQVVPGSAAEQAGVREGDVLLGLNGAAFPRQPERWLHEHRGGETVRLLLRRNGQEKEVSFQLGKHQEHSYQIDEVPNASQQQQRIREGILRGITEAPRR